ncbi:hypothetical protein GGX14DRAFT_580499 [Mycena pura]|uniref:Uncharacterized protein n=1 Tax=Mycena pura TaxID=153505 RepID=A0AAD6UQ89_9AGAR|nr:hypothetical protein GGX14DRAFT_580499 [Mycena pura]
MACPCLHARPLRLVRLARYGHLDRWIGTADLKAAPERFMGSPLPDDLAMCELYISVIKGGDGPTYRLSLAAYHHLLGPTLDIHLARFVGTPHDADAPLWLRRVPTGKLLRWPQPLEFVGMVVGGLTDIPVEPLVLGGTNEIRMAHWSQDALRTQAHPPSSRCSEKVVDGMGSDDRGSPKASKSSTSATDDGSSSPSSSILDPWRLYQPTTSTTLDADADAIDTGVDTPITTTNTFSNEFSL